MPGGLTIEQAGKLTPWQVRHIYRHPRDRKTGELIFAPPQSNDDPREFFFMLWRRRGILDDWRIEAKWKAQQKG